MPKSVLVVDDDPAQRRILEETIKRFGYAVTTADSGEKAIAALKADARATSRSSCSTSSCPAPTAWRCCRPCAPCRARHPAIVQTATATSKPPSPPCGAGAVDFVVKPVSPERLEVSIKNALKIDALEGEISRMKASARGELGVRRPGRRQRSHGQGRRPRPQGGAVLDPRADRRRERRRQGDDRPRHPGRERPRRQALRHRQLRRHPAKLDREPSCSATRGLFTGASAWQDSSRPIGARCSSTRSASCRSRRRSSCCARCKTARSRPSAQSSRSRSTSA